MLRDPGYEEVSAIMNTCRPNLESRILDSKTG
jgi:hypothetical protein